MVAVNWKLITMHLINEPLAKLINLCFGPWIIFLTMHIQKLYKCTFVLCYTGTGIHVSKSP